MTLDATLERSLPWLAPQGRKATPTAAISDDEILSRWEYNLQTPEPEVPEVIIVINSSEAPPRWLPDVIYALQRCLYLDSDWDSYGARKIELYNVISAIKLLLDVIQDSTPKPIVVPTNSGGIQYEWHRNGIDLEIEIDENRIRWFFEDTSTGESRAKLESLDKDFSELTDLISRLL